MASDPLEGNGAATGVAKDPTISRYTCRGEGNKLVGPISAELLTDRKDLGLRLRSPIRYTNCRDEEGKSNGYSSRLCDGYFEAIMAMIALQKSGKSSGRLLLMW